ncbi:hypothetical protein [Microcoleus sp. bin38.metabat.b11b12b14.051]|nr:hypothetical protein [Microcoleus sp. bin38.metabat.b11b12b14.051]
MPRICADRAIAISEFADRAIAKASGHIYLPLSNHARISSF